MCPTEMNPVDDCRDFEEIQEDIQAIWPGFHHKVLGDLSAGGCGQTVKICWTASGEPAVLKYLFSAVEPDQNQESLFRSLSLAQWRRFLEQEARIMYAFRGFDAAIDVLDLHSSYQAFVMEFLPGGSLLDHVMEQGQSLSWQTKVLRFMPLLELLIALQNEGIYHRDLTLDNILLTSDGNLKLADFGLAHHLQEPIQEAVLGGKPGYFHPLKMKLNQKPLRNDIHDVYSATICLLAWIAGVDPNEEHDGRGNWVEKCPDELVNPLMDILLPGPCLPPFATRIGSFEYLKECLPASPEKKSDSRAVSWLPIDDTWNEMKKSAKQEALSISESYAHLSSKLGWEESSGHRFAFLSAEVMELVGKNLGISWDRCAGRNDLAAMLNWEQAKVIAASLGLELPDASAATVILEPAPLVKYWQKEKRAENMAFIGPTQAGRAMFESTFSRSPYRAVCLVRPSRPGD